ncbi:MAG: hypothetical protein JWM34_3312 [Ilumatobacteraceae bacterium]|nr:hypothetical protein [Ilumatobacteraceae bacterium]
MKDTSCSVGRHQLSRRVVSLVVVSVALVAISPSWASAGPVDGSPDSTGMPGAHLVSQLVNWLMWVSLMASLGAVLYGAAMWRGGAKLGNSPRAEDGRHYVAGGAIGALLSGLAVVLVNTLFAVGRAGG